MTWPALYNHYPLLYPDSVTYLADGRAVARALFLHEFSNYYGIRSFFYSLGILPFHWNVTPWPIVALHALLTAYVIWLVVRSVLPRQTISRYLVLVVLLSLLTSGSCFVSLVMPDVLGPVLYLCIYLLVFARETLSFIERLTLVLIAWWAVASHNTHMILAGGMCVLLALVWILWNQLMQHRLKAVFQVATIALFAAGAQVALHTFLYGEPSLTGENPPFLMARVIADGPGRWYLQQHCWEVNLAVCDYVYDLPDSSDAFLWREGSIWQSATDDTAERLRREEILFVFATLRAYPCEQLRKSAANSWRQMRSFGLGYLNENDWVLEAFDSALPERRSSYLNSLQAQSALPLPFFTLVQRWTVIVSLLVLGVLIPLMWHQKRTRLLGLSVAIVPTAIANAFVTGALSNVEDRYQSRIIWLLPLLAGILVFYWFDRGRNTTWASRKRPTELGLHPESSAIQSCFVR